MKLEGAVLNETCHMKVKAAIITYMRGGETIKQIPSNQNRMVIIKGRREREKWTDSG